MNALQAVREIRTAEQQVATWPQALATEVHAAIPHAATTRGYTRHEWAVTVEVFRGPLEHPVDAAQRLARYLTLHAERFHKTPTLASLQHPRRLTPRPGG